MPKVNKDVLPQEEQVEEQVQDQEQLEQEQQEQDSYAAPEETEPQNEPASTYSETPASDDESSKQYRAEENGKRKLDNDTEGSKAKRPAYEGAGDYPTAVGSAAAAAPSGGDVTEIFRCPYSKVGKLIGKGGSTIKELEEKSHTKLQVDQSSSGSEKPVRITGTKAAVENAIKLINELLESDTPPAGEETRQIECAKGLVGRVIGRAGEAIRLMQRSSGARITVNQDVPDDQPRIINVVGLPDAVDRASKMITELINGEHASAQNVIQKYGFGVTRTVACPKDKVGCIIGRGGSTIKELQKRFSVSIEIKQTSEPCQIILTGTEESVNRAKQNVQDLISGGNRPGGHFGKSAAGGFAGNFAPVGGFAPSNYSNPNYGAYPGGFPGYSGYPAYPGSYGVPNASAYPGYGNAAGYGSDPYSAAAAAASFGGGYPNAAGSSTQAAAAVPSGSVWQAVADDQNRTYYYNSQTGKSQWDKPAEMP